MTTWLINYDKTLHCLYCILESVEWVRAANKITVSAYLHPCANTSVHGQIGIASQLVQASFTSDLAYKATFT